MLRARLKRRSTAVAAGLLLGASIAFGSAPAAEQGPSRVGAEGSAGAGNETVLDPFLLRAQRERAAGPFHPVPGRVGYGDAAAAFGNARGRAPEGQDIFAVAGTAVVAPSADRVVEAGNDGGRGNWVAIYDRKRQRSYIYLHLLEAADVATGERVAAGRRVGLLGCTGSCYGDHLHFEIRVGRGPYGAAIDPLPLLRRWDQAPR